MDELSAIYLEDFKNQPIATPELIEALTIILERGGIPTAMAVQNYAEVLRRDGVAPIQGFYDILNMLGFGIPSETQ